MRWCLDNFPRFHEFRGQKTPVGASVDLMQELAKRVGFRIEYSPQIPLARCFRLIENGEMDLITNLKLTPEREAAMYMFPYSESNPESIYQRGNDKRVISQVSQLSQLTVATVRNYAYHEAIMVFIRENQGTHSIEVENIAAGFETLARGRVDALIVPSFSSLDLLEKTPRLHKKFKRAPIDLKSKQNLYGYVGFSRKSRHPELANQIREQLKQMMADGTVKKYYTPVNQDIEKLVLVQP